MVTFLLLFLPKNKTNGTNVSKKDFKLDVYFFFGFGFCSSVLGPAICSKLGFGFVNR